MERTRAVNIRTEEFDVFIGRPSAWGNPFSHLEKSRAQFRVKSREEAIARFHEWIQTQPELLARLPELRGKRLGCYCSPKSCHGEVLAALADGLPWPPQPAEPTHDQLPLEL